MAGVTLTASEIDLNTINKYLEYTNFPDLWDLVKPSYIGEKVTINPVDVLVPRGLSVEDAEAFLNSLTFNERQLISLAYADPMGNEFLEENVLRVYNLHYDNYLNKKQGHQNNNDVSEGAGTIAAGGTSGLPPDDDDDNSNRDKNNNNTQNNASKDPNEIKHTYNSIKDSPNYPKGFRGVQNGTTKHNVNNGQALENLRKIEQGQWKKVYQNGYDSSGNRVSIHYFQSQSGRVFNVKVKPGWSLK
ncbi:hypothetical protein J3U22_06305 [Gilliamella sp. B2865]|uniref:hypothetical protein n=1 Tax=unclassified Gilliamella TaxID=2685620 RepID=UPI002269CF2A|nr:MULTISPECIES: hypothetical protein [unclassified Gilliamella]MCX8670870.1 hypothetical protein [Gilliamella sp. B2785]MCX8679215.1 hypothetical protein [Gilliamella sp. B2865]